MSLLDLSPQGSQPEGFAAGLEAPPQADPTAAVASPTSAVDPATTVSTLPDSIANTYADPTSAFARRVGVIARIGGPGMALDPSTVANLANDTSVNDAQLPERVAQMVAMSHVSQTAANIFQSAADPKARYAMWQGLDPNTRDTILSIRDPQTGQPKYSAPPKPGGGGLWGDVESAFGAAEHAIGTGVSDTLNVLGSSMRLAQHVGRIVDVAATEHDNQQLAQASDQGLAIQKSGTNPFKEFGFLWDLTSKGNQIIAPYATDAAKRTLGNDDARYQIARKLATGTTAAEIASDQTGKTAIGPDFQTRMAAIETMQGDPAFKKALAELQRGHMSLGRQIAHFGLQAAGGNGNDGFFYSALSGGLDALWDIKADPLGYAGKAVEAFKAGAQSFTDLNQVRQAIGDTTAVDAAAAGRTVTNPMMRGYLGELAKAIPNEGLAGVDNGPGGIKRAATMIADGLNASAVSEAGGPLSKVAKLTGTMDVMPALRNYMLDKFSPSWIQAGEDADISGLTNQAFAQAKPSDVLDFLTSDARMRDLVEGKLGNGAESIRDATFTMPSVSRLGTSLGMAKLGLTDKIDLMADAINPNTIGDSLDAPDPQAGGIIRKALAVPASVLKGLTASQAGSYIAFGDTDPATESGAAEQFNRLLNYGISGPQRSIYTEQLLKSATPALRAKIINEGMGKLFNDAGLQFSAEGRDFVDTYVNKIGQTFGPDGLSAPGNRAINSNDLANAVAIPTYRDFMRTVAVSRKAALLQGALGDSGTENGLTEWALGHVGVANLAYDSPFAKLGDTALPYWRRMVTMRVGFAARVAAEESIGHVLRYGAQVVPQNLARIAAQPDDYQLAPFRAMRSAFLLGSDGVGPIDTGREAVADWAASRIGRATPLVRSLARSGLDAVAGDDAGAYLAGAQASSLGRILARTPGIGGLDDAGWNELVAANPSIGQRMAALQQNEAVRMFTGTALHDRALGQMLASSFRQVSAGKALAGLQGADVAAGDASSTLLHTADGPTRVKLSPVRGSYAQYDRLADPAGYGLAVGTAYAHNGMAPEQQLAAKLTSLFNVNGQVPDALKGALGAKDIAALQSEANDVLTTEDRQAIVRWMGDRANPMAASDVKNRLAAYTEGAASPELKAAIGHIVDTGDVAAAGLLAVPRRQWEDEIVGMLHTDPTIRAATRGVGGAPGFVPKDVNDTNIWPPDDVEIGGSAHYRWINDQIARHSEIAIDPASSAEERSAAMDRIRLHQAQYGSLVKADLHGIDFARMADGDRSTYDDMLERTYKAWTRTPSGRKAADMIDAHVTTPDGRLVHDPVAPGHTRMFTVHMPPQDMANLLDKAGVSVAYGGNVNDELGRLLTLHPDADAADLVQQAVANLQTKPNLRNVADLIDHSFANPEAKLAAVSILHTSPDEAAQIARDFEHTPPGMSPSKLAPISPWATTSASDAETLANGLAKMHRTLGLGDTEARVASVDMPTHLIADPNAKILDTKAVTVPHQGGHLVPADWMQATRQRPEVADANAALDAHARLFRQLHQRYYLTAHDGTEGLENLSDTPIHQAAIPTALGGFRPGHLQGVPLDALPQSVQGPLRAAQPVQGWWAKLNQLGHNKVFGGIVDGLAREPMFGAALTDQIRTFGPLIKDALANPEIIDPATQIARRLLPEEADPLTKVLDHLHDVPADVRSEGPSAIKDWVRNPPAPEGGYRTISDTGARVTPGVYLHGTAAGEAGVDLSDPIGRSARVRNLVGPGFYTTADPSIAETYTGKLPDEGGTGDAATIHRVAWKGPGSPNVLDLQNPPPAPVQRLLDHFAAQLGMTNPALSHGLDGVTQLADITEAAHEAGTPEVAAELNRAIANQGYDAMSHIGGTTLGGSEHPVTVWLRGDNLGPPSAENIAGASRLDGLARPGGPLGGLSNGELTKLLAADDHLDSVGYNAMRSQLNGTVARVLPWVHNPDLRSQMAETVRHIVPFQAAQEQFFRRWGRMLQFNPSSYVKAYQAFHAFENSPFYVTDPNTGQRQMVVPGSEQFMRILGDVEKLTGSRVGAFAVAPLTGSVTNILPGPGANMPIASPMLSVPTKLVGRITGFDTSALQDLEGNRNRSILEELFPSTVNNLYKATLASSDKDPQLVSAKLGALIYAEAHGQVPAEPDVSAFGNNPTDPGYLAAKAAYPAKLQAAIDRADNAARNLMMAKAVFGFTMPMTVTAHNRALDDLHPRFAELLKAYGDPAQAVMEMHREHPDVTVPELFAYSQAFTTSTGLRSLPTTSGAQEWLAAHPKVVSDLPQIAALLAPHATGPTSSAESRQDYYDQLANGLRRYDSPTELVNSITEARDMPGYQQILDHRDAQLLSLRNNPAQAAKVRAQSSIDEQNYLDTHPVLADAVLSSTKKAQRNDALTQLRAVVANPGAYNLDDSPVVPVVRPLLDMIDKASTMRDRLTSLGNTGRARITSLDSNLSVNVERYVMQHPELWTLYDSLIRSFMPKLSAKTQSSVDAQLTYTPNPAQVA